MKLKCFFKGHNWQILSRTRKDVCSSRTQYFHQMHTFFLYQCTRCQKLKEVHLEADYPEIPVDDLINIRD